MFDPSVAGGSLRRQLRLLRYARPHWRAIVLLTGTMTIDINLTDGRAHRLSLYAVDWDRLGRSERIELVDPANGAVLDARTLSGFGEGAYLTWQVQGHVQIRVTNLGGVNAVVSGLFLDSP